MPREMSITIVNQLVNGKRELNIYHHGAQSAHLISYNRTLTLPLAPVETGDYLHISIVSGPGPLTRETRIDLPWGMDFEFTVEGKAAVIHSDESKRTLLKIPAGPATWQLRVTRCTGKRHFPGPGCITVSDAAS
jgi:hypothetical protein